MQTKKIILLTVAIALLIIIFISGRITNPGYEDNKNTHYAGNKPENSSIIQKLNIKQVELEINTKISLENTHWVDVNERILVKSESKSGNLKIGEMYLVS